MSDALAANQSRATDYLARFQRVVVPHFIAGQAVGARSGATFDTLDPATNAQQCVVAAGDAEDIDAAAKAAAAAFPIWRALSGARRRRSADAIAYVGRRRARHRRRRIAPRGAVSGQGVRGCAAEAVRPGRTGRAAGFSEACARFCVLARGRAKIMQTVGKLSGISRTVAMSENSPEFFNSGRPEGSKRRTKVGRVKTRAS